MESVWRSERHSILNRRGNRLEQSMDEGANDSPCQCQACVSRGADHRPGPVAVARRNDADRRLNHPSSRIHRLREEKQRSQWSCFGARRRKLTWMKQRMTRHACKTIQVKYELFSPKNDFVLSNRRMTSCTNARTVSSRERSCDIEMRVNQFDVLLDIIFFTKYFSISCETRSFLFK